MAGENIKRKLAAILYADVVGYSRLMGADEEGTHRTVAEYLDCIAESITDHDGRVVHYAGDAVLADFASVVAAVRCAVEVQKELAARNADIPDDRKVLFRIGVNLGDVIIDRDNIYGDGVNVAARLESLADPGGICVSRKVLDEIQGKIEVGFEDMGRQHVKNIAEPVQIYRVGLEKHFATTAPPQLPDKPSIAVLPFENLSGNPDQEHFVDGMTEDIITELSRFHSHLVIARNSSFTYKVRSVTVAEIAKELGVRYVIEGSARQSGGRMRVSAQLIEADTGGQIWAERYDRDVQDLFAVQDEITRHIVSAIEPQITVAEGDRATRKEPGSLGAWDYYYRAQVYLRSPSSESIARVEELAAKAIESDPASALGYKALAQVRYLALINGWLDGRDDALGFVIEPAQKMVALDDQDAEACAIWARMLLRLGRHEEAVLETRQALDLNPNFAQGYAHHAICLASVGRGEEALQSNAMAFRLSPRDTSISNWYCGRSFVNLQLGRYEDAKECGLYSRNRSFQWLPSHYFLLVALGHLDRRDEAAAAVDRLLQVQPDASVRYAERRFRYLCKHAEDWSRFIDGLRKAGLPE